MAMIHFFLFLSVFGAVGALCAYSCSRPPKLAALAKNYGCHFERHKNSVTTAVSAGKLELFIQFFHQFYNVFTFTTPTAFVRLADDFIFTDENPHTKPLVVTLFTAEMRRLQFPTLKITPAGSALGKSRYAPLKTNIPALEKRYHIYAPSPACQVLLTPFITGLLKENDSIYLEVNESALIYHEHTLLEPTQIDAFRFRAMKILNELETVLQSAAKAANPPENKTDEINTPEQNRAEALLASLAQTQPQNVPGPSKNFRLGWLIVVFALFLGITFFSWFALHHWLGK